MYIQYKNLPPSCSQKPVVSNKVYKPTTNTYLKVICVTECQRFTINGVIRNFKERKLTIFSFHP